jgi:hypothetical protein
MLTANVRTSVAVTVSDFHVLCSHSPVNTRLITVTTPHALRPYIVAYILRSFCRLALHILSIFAMSAEPERLFSDTKKIITAERHFLLPATIEAIEDIKSFNQ